MTDMNGGKKLLVKNSEVWQDGKFIPLDILVEDGLVAKIEPGITVEDDMRVIDARGMHTLPGFVDLHVHFREPGYSYKETIKSGSEAAAAGGFTTVCTMPNLNPVPDTVENLQKQLDIIGRDAVVEVIPYCAITLLRMGGGLVDYKSVKDKCIGFSDDGSGVQDEEIMRAAMKGIAESGKILAAHCEVESLLEGGYIHKGKYAAANGHRGICSESEWKEVERDIRLAEETGCRLHICHVSTKESVELIRQGKKRGVKVTAETGPHYFAFCDNDLQEDGRFKMNPPLRSEADMLALQQGAADGTLDAVATDHAPHSSDEKNRGLEKSAMGVVGLETSFAAMNTYMVKKGIITRERLVEMMADAPRRIFGIKGGLHVGDRADIAIVDFDKEWVVNPAEFKTMGRATPFAGLTLTGDVMATIASGKIVHNKFDN